MPEINYVNILALALVSVGAPLVVGMIRAPVPDVVAQIGGGIVLGPSVLGWVEIDAGVQILSALGLAYLLFISGMEIEPATMHGPLLGLGLRAFGLSIVIAVAAAIAFRASGLIDNVGLVVAALITTSLGIVVSVLKDHGAEGTDVGQLTLLCAALGDFGSVALLSVIFADTSSGVVLPVLLLALFGLAGLAIVGAIVQARTLVGVRAAFSRRAGSATQIYVRASFALMVGFAALADSLGLEAILGAFAAGVAMSVLDVGAANRQEVRAKLEAIGFGVLAPIFFVTSGLRFDLGALTETADGLALLPLLFVAMAVARVTPSILFTRKLGGRRALAAGLLLSTKLTFVVAAVEIARSAGAVRPEAASAMVAASVLTVLAFPTLAGVLLARSHIPPCDVR